MNAFQPFQPTPPPQPQRHSVPRPKKRLRQRSYQIMVLETSAKITVNLVIIAAAVSTLTQLLPYHWLQQDRLREIRTEVKLLDARVNNLRKEFSRAFDPSQTNIIRREESYRFPRNQKHLIIIDSDIQDAQKPAPAPE